MIEVNMVLQGAVRQLEALFPDVPVDAEPTPPGAVPPYFFVRLTQVSQVKEIGSRYKRSHTIGIRYVPVDSDPQAYESMHQIAEQLYGGLELIGTDAGACRAGAMKHEIIDSALHFEVSYDFHVMRQRAEEPQMRTMTQEGYVK